MQFNSSYKCAETEELKRQTDRQTETQTQRELGVGREMKGGKVKSVETKKKAIVFWLWFGRDSIPFITL